MSPCNALADTRTHPAKQHLNIPAGAQAGASGVPANSPSGHACAPAAPNIARPALLMKVYQRAALPLHRGTAYARATCLPALATAAPCLPLAATVGHPSLGHCRGATASNCTPVHPAPLSPPSLRAHSATAHGGHAASDMPARRPADLIGINFRAISARPEASEALFTTSSNCQPGSQAPGGAGCC